MSGSAPRSSERGWLARSLGVPAPAGLAGNTRLGPCRSTASALRCRSCPLPALQASYSLPLYAVAPCMPACPCLYARLLCVMLFCLAVSFALL